MSVRSLFLIPALLGGLLIGDATAQSATPAGLPAAGRQFETREQLTAQAVAAERQGKESQAWLLRSRLSRGDFQEGDRIVVVLEGSAVALDTLQVRSGKLLQFPRMGALSLEGVLRSELSDTVRTYLAQYINAPVVRATPLLPIAVLGSVLQPGYYYVPADVVLRDVLMKAGGPLGAADVSKIEVRRGGEVIWKPADVRVALADGLSIDGLHLRAGDELVVPERRRFDTNTLIALISSGVAVMMAVVNMSQ